MNRASVSNSEPDFEHPPRFWWIKRLIVVFLVLFAFAAGLMRWWHDAADRRMQTEIDAIHLRGEPVLVEDFESSSIPDRDNAALTLKSAAAAIPASMPSGDIDRFVPPDEEALATLSQAAAMSGKTRQLARIARFQKQADWGIVVRSPVFSVLLPHLSPQRGLSRALDSDAMFEHANGNDAEAIEIVRDMLHQSQMLQQDRPFLVTHLVAVGIDRLASERIRALSYDLDVMPESSTATTSPSSGASRQQVRVLIADLLDESAYRRGYAAALMGERVGQYDVSVTAVPPYLSPSPGIKLFKPMYELDTIQMMRATAQVGSVTSNAKDYPAARAQMPDPQALRMRDSGTTAKAFTRIIGRLLMPAFGRSVQRHFEGLMHRRVAVLLLAIRLYQIDHDGQFPTTLDELVPQYLDRLPADPFRADGKTFGYRLSPQPMIWSVGEDGVDDNGSGAILSGRTGPNATDPPAGDPRDAFFENHVDYLFLLERPAPLPPKPKDEN